MLRILKNDYNDRSDEPPYCVGLNPIWSVLKEPVMEALQRLLKELYRRLVSGDASW